MKRERERKIKRIKNIKNIKKIFSKMDVLFNFQMDKRKMIVYSYKYVCQERGDSIIRAKLSTFPKLFLDNIISVSANRKDIVQ